jgi:hypothetical protein
MNGISNAQQLFARNAERILSLFLKYFDNNGSNSAASSSSSSAASSRTNSAELAREVLGSIRSNEQLPLPQVGPRVVCDMTCLNELSLDSDRVNDEAYRQDVATQLRGSAAQAQAEYNSSTIGVSGLQAVNMEALAEAKKKTKQAEAVEALMFAEGAPMVVVPVDNPFVNRATGLQPNGRGLYSDAEQNMIRIGRLVHHVLIKGDNLYEASLLQYVPTDDLKRGHAYLQKYFVACLVWFWDYLAAHCGEAAHLNQQFTEGMFQLEYRHDAVFKFMQSVQFDISPEGYNGAEVNLGAAGGAYMPPREFKSGRLQGLHHFEGYARAQGYTNTQYVLDFSRDNVQLPCGHQELLFGALGTDGTRFFVKPRTHVSLAAVTRGNEGRGIRKEHLPQALKDAYRASLERNLVDDADKKGRIVEYMRELDAKGIQYLHKLIGEGTLNDLNFNLEYEPFAQHLDNLDIRFGREVILRFTNGNDGGDDNIKRCNSGDVLLSDAQRACVWKELIGVDVPTKAIGSKIILPKASRTAKERVAIGLGVAVEAAAPYAQSAYNYAAGRVGAWVNGNSGAASSAPVVPDQPSTTSQSQPAPQAQQGWLAWGLSKLGRN